MIIIGCVRMISITASPLHFEKWYLPITASLWRAHPSFPRDSVRPGSNACDL
jgi:hypothetical protein